MTGVWVEETPMTEGRYKFGLCVFRGDLWAVGGGDETGNPNLRIGTLRGTLRSCAHYDVSKQIWVRGPDMVTERKDAAVSVLNGELRAIGGMDDNGNTLSSCERMADIVKEHMADIVKERMADIVKERMAGRVRKAKQTPRRGV